MRKLTRSLVSALVTGVAAFTLTVAAAPAAHADPTSGTPTEDTTSACVADLGSAGGLLAVTRWKDATTGLHTRLQGWSLESAANLANRSQSFIGINAGNVMFSMAAWAVEGSMHLCPLDVVGENIDKAAGVVGNAFKNSPVMAVGLAVAFAGIMGSRASMRGGGTTIAAIGKKLLVIGVMSVMTVGAASSTTVDGHFKPGAFSPGWFIVKTDRVISSIASAPVAAVASYVGGEAEITPGGADNGSGVLSCQAYIKAMHDQYKAAYGDAMDSAAATTPLLVSSLWEQSGYTAWKKAQFGSNSGGFVDYAACRYLEMQADSPVYFSDDGVTPRANTLGAMADLQSKASGIPKDVLWRHHDAVAWWYTLNNDDEDKALLAWASCKLTDPSKYEQEDGWSVHTGAKQLFRSDTQDDAVQQAACYKFFNESDPSVLAAWDWSGDAATTAKDSGNSLASNFILAWQGRGATDQSAAIAYAVSGLAMLIVFGLLAGGILVAKVAALFMMAMMFLSMAIATITNTEEKVLGLAKQYVGISLFAWMAQLVMSLVAVLSAAMVQLTPFLPGGQGGLFGIIWTGASPLIAVWVMSKLFKEAGLPSPFSLKGALALGSATSAMGAGAAADGMLGVGAAAAGMGMGHRLARKASSTIGKSANKAIGDKGWGALTSRFSRMKPSGGGGVGDAVADMAKMAAGAGVGSAAAHAIDNVWDEKRERKARDDAAGKQSKKGAAAAKRREEAFDQWLTDTGQSRTRTPSTLRERAAHRKTERREKWDSVRAAFTERPLQTIAGQAWGGTKVVAKTAGKLGVGLALGGAPGVMVAAGAMLAQKTRRMQKHEAERDQRLDAEHQADLMDRFQQKLDADAAAAEAAKQAKKAQKKAQRKSDKDVEPTQPIPVGAGAGPTPSGGPSKPGPKSNTRTAKKPK